MKKHCIDIPNCICMEISNNPLTYNADIFTIKNIRNKQALRLFISCISYPFILFIFTCIPEPACAGEIMKPETGHEIGDLFPILPLPSTG